MISTEGCDAEEAVTRGHPQLAERVVGECLVLRTISFDDDIRAGRSQRWQSASDPAQS